VQYGTGSQIAARTGSQFGAVPGRIYPCKDGFVHILTIRPNHWRGLLEALGNPETMAGEAWFGGEFRNRNVDTIDAYVTEFTMQGTKTEITELCQAHGVPCTPVNTTADFSRDPHVRERGFFVQLEHPVIGRHSYLSPPYLLSATPCRIERPAPLLGQHNREVYCGELGYSAQEFERLKGEGVI
jgi:crotonobetainyl-CoA:carnitine CoA-transferase CaiB-like acyl-CoA transferase